MSLKQSIENLLQINEELQIKINNFNQAIENFVAYIHSIT